MSPTRFVLGTRNAHKAREIREILGERTGIEILTPDQLGLAEEPVEDRIEVYHSFRENAVAKARHFAERAGLPAIADDSGLRVDALDGEPGVRSARFAADAGFGRDYDDADEANNALLLQRLDGVPPERRSARFICVAAVVAAERPASAFVGLISGRIGYEPRGRHGFGYDPLFDLPDRGISFAQVPPDEKNRHSHRSGAFRALASRLDAIVASVQRGEPV